MKKLLIAALVLSSVTMATAGEVTYIAPEAITMEAPQQMGGSGAWIIPLVIVGVLALALTSNGEAAPSCNLRAALIADPCD